MEIHGNDLDNLVRPLVVTISDVSYPGRGRANVIRYLPEATVQDKVVGDAIAAGFLQAIIGTDKTTIAADGIEIVVISATVDNGDIEAIVTVFGGDGEIEFEDTIPVVNGDCNYQLSTAIADVYKIRAYGTISYMSNYIEVTAT